MATPKTYIYSFDHLKVLICSYSMELFNHLIKHARANGLTYTGDLEIISHKIHNRSNCNCREIVKAAVEKFNHKFKTFEKVILPLEILELDQANAYLFICEVHQSHNVPSSKLRIINITIKNGSNGQQMKSQVEKPKHCLLKLYRILNEEIWIKKDSLGRNNSFNGGKSLIYKECLKEISRELASKGALPGDLSQKCIYSRDNNRCWFDYCRLMDICISHKITAREIADIIKHLAAVDPMQPDPVICIKNKFENSESHNNYKNFSESSESEKDSLSESGNSFTNSLGSSSSLSELLVYKTNRTEAQKNRSSKYKFNDSGHHRKNHSKFKTTVKQTQTLDSMPIGSQADRRNCRCFKLSPVRPQFPPNSNELESQSYLWSPDNEFDFYPTFDDKRGFYDDGGHEYSTYDNGQYQPVKGIMRKNTYQNIDNDHYGEFAADQLDEDEYDPRIYEDFIRQNGISDTEDICIPGNYNESDRQSFYEGSNADFKFIPNQASKFSGASERVAPRHKTVFLRPVDKGNDVTRTRSSSQPMLPTKFKTYKLLSNTNNSQKPSIEFGNDSQTNKLENKINTANSSTQTFLMSQSLEDVQSSPLKKFASDSALCVRTADSQTNTNKPNEENEINNPNLQGLGMKIFKGEAVQTDSPPSDLSGNISASIRSSSQQMQSGDPNSIFNPKWINKHKTALNEHNICFQHHSTKTHLKALCDSSQVWNESVERKFRENPFAYTVNRNANNHSLSRSASSRNSQIVEIENESVDKVSSVLVEADSRSIILFREYQHERFNNKNKTNSCSRSPFFEIGSTPSMSSNYRINTNINNAIKNVTVSNQAHQDPPIPGLKIYKCAVPGCRNLTEDTNYSCPSHTVPFSPDSSCSPERCLSRLSCIVGLNKQILENPDIDRHNSVHINALHNALYGPYNDEDCSKVLGMGSQKFHKKPSAPIKSEYVNNDSQYLLSLNDPNRRFCNRHDSPHLINPNHISQPLVQPSYSATKFSHQSLCECYDLQSRKYVLQEIQDIHNPATMAYQHPIGETVLPLPSTPIRDCRSAKVSSCPKQTKENTRNNEFPAIIMNPSKICILSQTHPNFNEQFRYNNYSPCGRRIPVNLQLCPIEGCLNLTCTNSPPCLNRQDHDNFQPDKNFLNYHLTSPLNRNVSEWICCKPVTGNRMPVPANCEVILDEELEEEPSIDFVPEEPNVGQKLFTSKANQVKTVSANSNSLLHKGSNASKRSQISNVRVPSKKYDLVSDPTAEAASNMTPIKHISSHHSTSNALENYKPSSIRASINSEMNEVDSLKLPPDKLSSKRVNDEVDSNVNHTSESLFLIQMDPNIMQSSKSYSVKHEPSNEAKDRNDASKLPQLRTEENNKSFYNSKSQSDLSSRTLPVSPQKVSRVRNIEPDYTVEKLSKQFVKMSHNESFSPVSIFTNLTDDKSNISHIFLVEPPDCQLNDSKILQTEKLVTGLLIQSDPEVLETYLKSEVENIELNTSRIRETSLDLNTMTSVKDAKDNFTENLANIDETEGRTVCNLLSNPMEFDTEFENENTIANINKLVNVSETEKQIGTERQPVVENISKEPSFSEVKQLISTRPNVDIFPKINDLTKRITNQIANHRDLMVTEVSLFDRSLYGKSHAKPTTESLIKQNPFITSISPYPTNETSIGGNVFLNYCKERDLGSSQTRPKGQITSTLFKNKVDSKITSKPTKKVLNINSPKIKSNKGDLDILNRETFRSFNITPNTANQWKNISVFNQRFKPPNPLPDPTEDPCTKGSNIYSYALEIDVGKTYVGPEDPYFICKLGKSINNSSNIKLVSTKGNHHLNTDKVLFQSILTTNTSTAKSSSFVPCHVENNFAHQNYNIFFSTPDLIFNSLKYIITPEKFRLKSNLALEYCEPNSDSLAAVVDQPTNTQNSLSTAYVTIQTCNHTTPLLTVSQNISKTKKSKIRKLFRSIKSTKSQKQQFYCVQNEQKSEKTNKFLKTIFLLELKTKMMSFIKKYKSKGANESDKSQITSSDIEILVNDSESYSFFTDNLIIGVHGDKPSQNLNLSKCNLWTRSCCDLHIRSRPKNQEICFKKIKKRSFSEPVIENTYKTRFDSNNLFRTSSITYSEIPTSGLSLLCFEVLEKMERKLGRNPRLVGQLAARKFIESVDLWSQSSKDTLKLIGRALHYLHGNHPEDSRQSNKTLDSVSSIRTCSADCIESISSLRQQIIRPIISTDTVISAYNKYLS